MNLGYFLLLVTLKNINCYNPKRHTQSSTNLKKNSNTDPVIPARYKMASKNYNPAVLQTSPIDYFPEVEYPESIAEASKPFYVSTSPFPNDVETTFHSLAAARKSKAKSTIDFSWNHNQNVNKDDDIENVVATKGDDINSNEKSTNETLKEDITDDSIHYETPDNGLRLTLDSDNNMDKLFSNWSSAEESTEHLDTDYILGFINDMDEFMKNLTYLETIGLAEGESVTDNVTGRTLGNECSDELASVCSHSSHNNDSNIEFNGKSFLAEEYPECTQVFEESNLNDTLSILSWFSNTNESFVDDIEYRQQNFHLYH